MLTRICKKCNTELPLSEFPQYKTVDEIIYRRHVCVECQREWQVQYEKNNPDAKRRAYVLRVWKMELEEYDAILSSGCEVCGTTENLVLDHDHRCCPDKRDICGKCIRGVLCNRHNLAEGYLQGNPEEAILLAEYMRKNRGEPAS
jgi:hypothetical protein